MSCQEHNGSDVCFCSFIAILIDQKAINNLWPIWGRIYPPVPIKSLRWHDLWIWLYLTAAAVSSASVLLLQIASSPWASLLLCWKLFFVFFKLKAQNPALWVSVWWRRTWDPSCLTPALRNPVSVLPHSHYLTIMCIKIFKSVVKNWALSVFFCFDRLLEGKKKSQLSFLFLPLQHSSLYSS